MSSNLPFTTARPDIVVSDVSPFASNDQVPRTPNFTSLFTGTFKTCSQSLDQFTRV